jgi:CubicO group peptidase (beta-lactamase class C family)
MKAYSCLPVLTAVAALTAGPASLTRAAESSQLVHGWTKATPEEVGIDSRALMEMFDVVRARQIPIHSVQIIRKGRLALDAYFYPYDGRTRHDVASVTKSITSMLVGLAIDRGYIRSVKQPVLDFFPTRSEARIERQRPKQTIEDLLTMRSGWDCGFEPNEGRLFEMRRSSDWVRFMLELPMAAEPGTRYRAWLPLSFRDLVNLGGKSHHATTTSNPNAV